MSDDPENEDDGLPEDISPENAARCLAALPSEIQAEIAKEADAQATDMVHKFESHAMQYEREHPESAPAKA